MLQLDLLTGEKAGARVEARRFPFSVGRAAGCSLVLNDGGVWDRHLEIQWRGGQGFFVTAGADGLVFLNGETVQESLLHSGDLLELGSVKLRFGLSPTRQRRQQVREALTWIALGAVSLGQVALIYLLG